MVAGPSISHPPAGGGSLAVEFGLEGMRPVCATSIRGFVQQLAVGYVARGYWFHVVGTIPAGKPAERVDAKLVERYEAGLSRWAQARRRADGQASVKYIRHDRVFVLLASHGRHRFFTEEASSVRDARRSPIRVYGYAISHRGGRTHVRIDETAYALLKSRLTGLATKRSADALAASFARVSFEPYAPVRRQLLNIWRAVNRRRKVAAMEPVPVSCIRMRRRIVSPFEEVDERQIHADRRHASMFGQRGAPPRRRTPRTPP